MEKDILGIQNEHRKSAADHHAAFGAASDVAKVGAGLCLIDARDVSLLRNFHPHGPQLGFQLLAIGHFHQNSSENDHDSGFGLVRGCELWACQT